MPFKYLRDRPQARRRLLERLAAGETLAAVCADDGMPDASSVRGWARRDAGFAAELAAARRAGDWRRRFAYDEEKGAAVIARLAAGERIAQVLRDPAMPSWRTYRYWRRGHVWFAAEVGRVLESRASVRLEGLRGRHRPFDAAVAQRIYGRLWAGERLRAVLRSDPAFPSLAVFARWRREDAEFGAGVAFVLGAWRTKPRPARRRLTPALREAILDGIVLGGSLRSLGRRDDMPCAKTLYAWVRKDAVFAAAVAQACVDREDLYRDQLLAIAERVKPGGVGAARREMGPLWGRLKGLRRRPGGGRAA
jgi:hypothetical protein